MATIVGDGRFLGLEGYWLLAFLCLSAGAGVGLLLVWLRVRGAESGLDGLLEGGADVEALTAWLSRKRLAPGTEEFTDGERSLLALGILAAALAGWRGLPWRAETFPGHLVRGACWLGIAFLAGGVVIAAASLVAAKAREAIEGRIEGSKEPRCRAIATAWKASREAEARGKVEAILRTDDVQSRDRSASEIRDLPLPSYQDAKASALARLHAALSDDDARVRERAIRSLGVIGDVGALEEIASALDFEDTRLEAARALARLGDPRGLEVLLPLSPYEPSVLESWWAIQGREQISKASAQAGKPLSCLADDAWTAIASLINGMMTGDDVVASSASVRLLGMNTASAAAKVVGPVLVNRLVKDHARLTDEAIGLVAVLASRIAPGLMAPRRELAPALSRVVNGSSETSAFQNVIRSQIAWAEAERPRASGESEAERDAVRARMVEAYGGTRSGGSGPAAIRPGSRDDLVEVYAERILEFLRSPRTREFERSNGARWSRDDLVAVLFKAGLHHDVPPDLFSTTANRAVDELVAKKRIVGTDSGYRAEPA